MKKYLVWGCGVPEGLGAWVLEKGIPSFGPPQLEEEEESWAVEVEAEEEDLVVAVHGDPALSGYMPTSDVGHGLVVRRLPHTPKARQPTRASDIREAALETIHSKLRRVIHIEKDDLREILEAAERWWLAEELAETEAEVVELKPR